MMRPLSILYIAYPLLAVTGQSAGGAEQMLLSVEREMNARGHRTTVAAADGSRVCGELLATGPAASAPDQYEAHERMHSSRILEYLRRNPHQFDLIHDKSGSFFRHAADCPIPVLATLHLPRPFYKQEWFRNNHSPRKHGKHGRTPVQKIPCLPCFRGEFFIISGGRNAHGDPGQALEHSLNLYFNCVSNSQACWFAELPNLLGVVQNGIAAERFPFSRDKENYLLWLGRMCEEKGPHLAIAAAQRAGVPLVVAGQVYPFSYHQNYFEREIRPQLNGRVRFVDTPLTSQKLELLRHARALLLTSTVEETSSLVAMEAMACGTPVVAFRRGAFPEIVADEETGLVVDTVEEMAAAFGEVNHISPEKCRERVEQYFSAARMAQEYEELYRRVLTSAKELAA